MAKKSVKDLTTIFNFNNADYAHFCSEAGVDSKIAYGDLKTNIFSGYINQDVRTTANPTFANVTIGGLNASVLLSYLDQDVKSSASPTFEKVNDVVISLSGGANDVFISNGLLGGGSRDLNIDESKFLSDKADKTQLTSYEKTIYKQVADATVANTVTETTLFSGTSGARTIPANTLQAGSYLKIETMGKMSTNNQADTAQVKLTLNGTDILQSSQLQLAGVKLTDNLFTNDLAIKITSTGVSGSAQCYGFTQIKTGTGISSALMRAITASPITIDTTQDIVIDETYTWGQASVDCRITMSHAKISLSQG
jgi:hypothetical protein